MVMVLVLAALQFMHSTTIWVLSVVFQFLSEVKKVLMNHVGQVADLPKEV